VKQEIAKKISVNASFTSKNIMLRFTSNLIFLNSDESGTPKAPLWIGFAANDKTIKKLTKN